jgi:hypothetical protein
VDADHRAVPLPRRIIEDRPASSGRAAPTGRDTTVAAAVCDATVQAYGTPRQGAGGPLAEDVMKRQLKPMRRED